MNFSEKENNFKQVRTVKGGRTRHVNVDRYTTVREVQEMAESLFFPNGAFKSLKLEDHVCYICDFSQNKVGQDCTVEDLYEKNKESDVILLDEEISNMQMLYDHIRDEVEEQGRGLHAEEIRPVQGTAEMTTESNSIGQEEQGAYVTDVIPETQAGEMLLNNSNDSEVTIGASPGDPSELDDTLPWEGSKPKVIIVV
ncbi:hypothetical protein ABVT39_026368 [Epinephelus coioides]